MVTSWYMLKEKEASAANSKELIVYSRGDKQYG
jgi:hypothetical protein